MTLVEDGKEDALVGLGVGKWVVICGLQGVSSQRGYQAQLEYNKDK